MSTEHAMTDREKVARVLFERGRTVHDAESWEAAGAEMRAWLLGHAEAVLEALSTTTTASPSEHQRR